MGRRVGWTDADLTQAVAESASWRAVAIALGLSECNPAVQAAAARLGLDTTHFRGRAWNTGQGVGRDPEKQRAAARRWYEANRSVYLDRNTARRAAVRDLMRAAKSAPCADCGGVYPHFVMDLDHRDGEVKVGDVSRMVSYGRSRGVIEAEIAKCDAVCANCHRIRTARRGGWDGLPTQDLNLN